MKFKTNTQFSVIPVISFMVILALGILILNFERDQNQKLNIFKNGELAKANDLAENLFKLTANHSKFIEILSQSVTSKLSEEDIYIMGLSAIDVIRNVKENMENTNKKHTLSLTEKKQYMILLDHLSSYQKATTSAIEMVSAHQSLSSKYMLQSNQRFSSFSHEINKMMRNVHLETEKTLNGILFHSKRMVHIFIGVFLFSVALVSLLSFLVVKRFTGPIIQISKFVTTVKNNSDYSLRCQVKSQNIEICDLYTGVNSFLDEISQYHTKINKQNHQLEKVVNVRTKELRLAKEKAESSNNAKSLLLTNMSHELRTPLNAVIGYSEILEEDLNDPSQKQDAIRIKDSGKYLLTLINEMLDLAKLESGNFAVFAGTIEVKSLIGQIMDMIKPMADKNNNRLTVKIEPTIHAFDTDGKRLTQILLNLLSNACKFTKDGDIYLTVSHAKDHQVNFKVRDTGNGIKKEDLSRIFENFVQVHDINKDTLAGSGLGLPLTKLLVKALGGELTVESEFGAGSVFWFSLRPLEQNIAISKSPTKKAG